MILVSLLFISVHAYNIIHLILFFGNLPIDPSHVKDIGNLSEINNYTFVPFTGSIVHTVHNVNTNFILDLCSWTLFLDRSKSKYSFSRFSSVKQENLRFLVISF